MTERLSLPGFVDAHCHAFQRALRGRPGGTDFWSWRELMLAEAERQTPELVRREYVGLLLFADTPAELLDRFTAWQPPTFPRAWLTPSQT